MTLRAALAISNANEYIGDLGGLTACGSSRSIAVIAIHRLRPCWARKGLRFTISWPCVGSLQPKSGPEKYFRAKQGRLPNGTARVRDSNRSFAGNLFRVIKEGTGIFQCVGVKEKEASAHRFQAAQALEGF